MCNFVIKKDNEDNNPFIRFISFPLHYTRFMINLPLIKYNTYIILRYRVFTKELWDFKGYTKFF